MWIEAGGFGGIILLIGVITAMQNSKIDKAQTKEMCDERSENVGDSLKSGRDRFDKNDELFTEFTKALNKQNITLTKVHTIVTRMERNGNGGRKRKGVEIDDGS